jgi:hypothetical protein
VRNERVMLSVEREGMVLFLGSRDEPCTLYLSFDEARSLATDIRTELFDVQAAGEQENDIIVADAELDRSDAQDLLALVEINLDVVEGFDASFRAEYGENYPDSSSGHSPDRVDWLVEGF